MTTTAGLRPRSAGAQAGGRLVGIDAARGLALFGMFAAHLVDVEAPVDWTTPATWWSIVAGRSSVLFAVLAGVSLALMTGRATPLGGPRGSAGAQELRTARARIVVRGVLIAVIGLALMLLGTPVAVILTTYGLLFLLLLPALSWRRSTLLWTAGLLVVVAYPIADASFEPLSQTGPIRQQILYYYPLATFAAYLLVGLAVGRSGLDSVRILRRLLVGGFALAVVAYTLGELVVPGGILYGDGYPVDFAHAVFSSEPHTSTPVDMLGSIGVALAAIGACGLLSRAPAALAVPLRVIAGAGAMPLTIYSGHLVVVAVLYHSGFLDGLSPSGDAITWLCFVAGACLVGLAARGRSGPLERSVAAIARRIAPGGRPPTPPQPWRAPDGWGPPSPGSRL